MTQQEKKVRGPQGDRTDLRQDLLASSGYVVPAAMVGLAPTQPVKVRRLSVDALQQISSAVADLTGDPFPADKYPPAGRPWTTEDAKLIEGDRSTVAGEREELRPLLEAFGKQMAGLAAASLDPDPYTRIQARKAISDLAIIRSRLNRREASIPKGEGVPAPRPDTTPERKDTPPKSGGAFLPSGVTPSGTPILLVAEEKDKLVADEKDKPAPARPSGPDTFSAQLNSTLPAVVAGLRDPNVRARLGAIEVLETMGVDAVPVIPAMVDSLRDSDRFVRWAAARSLGRLAPRNADTVVPGLARLLFDGDLDVEVAAANALERYGLAATAAVAPLGLRSSRGDADIRIAAMHALEALGTQAAPALPSVALTLIPTTREQRERDIGPDAGPSPPPRARVAAAETLGRFGNLAIGAVPILQRSLNDVDADVRRAASEAILRITGHK